MQSRIFEPARSRDKKCAYLESSTSCINYQKFRTLLRTKFCPKFKTSETFLSEIYKRPKFVETSFVIKYFSSLLELISNSDVYKVSITSDFAKKNFKMGTQEPHVYDECCQFKQNCQS